MAMPTRIQLPTRVAAAMVWNYAKLRVSEQVKAVAFIIVYLVGFQWVVLRSTPAEAARIAVGIAMVVGGLAFFLEGLFLGLMPLGERVGLQLPRRCSIGVIVGFGLLLGFGSTLAEPAIAALRVAGTTVTPWDTPLLYRLLELEPDLLVMAVGAGVGVAVALGMIRFYLGFSLRWVIFTVIPLLLGMTAWCSRDPNLAHILNLAWDTGGVTTGPVTVPLVLALGLGVNRSVGRQDGTAGGFGIVTLASLFPILGVLALALLLNPSTPAPISEATFFSAGHRAQALELLGTEAGLTRLAFQRGSEPGRRARFATDASYSEALAQLVDPAGRHALLGTMTLQDWLQQRASVAERQQLAARLVPEAATAAAPPIGIATMMASEAGLAARAIIPLVALLLVVLLLGLRDRPRRTDEVVLGIGFALLGMTVLTSGIKLGLAPLGDQVGRPLPMVFRSMPQEERRVILEPFDPAAVFPIFDTNGRPEPHFYLKNRRGAPMPVPYHPARYDPTTRRYEHVVERPPLFEPSLTGVGVMLVLLFAFGLGYGSTIAEPALAALGRSVEELTVGTIRSTGVVRAVSLGVGIGLVLGVARIMYHLPMVWLVASAYLLLLVLTWFSEEDLIGIAWDSGGVTTGPITVPLVLSMGLGIGRGLSVIDGFGIVTMASVLPIITTLLYGLWIRGRQRQLHRSHEESTDAT